MQRRASWRNRWSSREPKWGDPDIFGDDGGEYAHDDGDAGLVQVRYLPVLDDVRGEHIDDQDDDEDEGLDVEGLARFRCHI